MMPTHNWQGNLSLLTEMLWYQNILVQPGSVIEKKVTSLTARLSKYILAQKAITAPHSLLTAIIGHQFYGREIHNNFIPRYTNKAQESIVITQAPLNYIFAPPAPPPPRSNSTPDLETYFQIV